MSRSEVLRESALLIELRHRVEMMNAERLAEAEYMQKLADAKLAYAQRLAAEITAELFAEEDS